jgi:hypothetical protein
LPLLYLIVRAESEGLKPPEAQNRASIIGRTCMNESKKVQFSDGLLLVTVFQERRKNFLEFYWWWAPSDLIDFGWKTGGSGFLRA